MKTGACSVTCVKFELAYSMTKWEEQKGKGVAQRFDYYLTTQWLIESQKLPLQNWAVSHQPLISLLENRIQCHITACKRLTHFAEHFRILFNVLRMD